VGKDIAPIQALVRSIAEDVGEHSLRRVFPVSSASTEKREDVRTDAILMFIRGISLIFIIK